MKNTWLFTVSCLFAFSGCSHSPSTTSSPAASPAPAQADNYPVTSGEVVTRFVAATNARDTKALENLLHPKSIACITPENKDFYDRAVATSLQPISAGYQVTDTPISATDKLPDEAYGVFPVRPTHQIEIQYPNGVEGQGIVLFWLVNENGHWYKDDPCISEAVIKQFHDDLSNIKAREQATRDLVAGIKEPLLSELKSLIRQGKPTSAGTRYREATGKDGTTALFVISELQEQMRQNPQASQ